MEEWIATLPGLGLGLGSWGNNDGALDWKYFQALKASNKLKKSRSASSVGTQKSAKDMIVENLQVMEMVIEGVEERHREELEEGLTPDEAEALELEAPATVPVVDNLPPPVNEPGLLHPEYRLVTGAGRILSGRRPQSRRGKDVAGRLDDMERYWAEQSLVMGTVLKRMLVVVDGLIVKEREQAQKEQRRVEMGWVDEGEVESLNVGTPREGEEAWGCSVA